MLLLSWNVAGLSTTTQRIYEQYGSSDERSSSSSGNVLASFFQQRHGADIVCLQEHKLSSSVLENRTEPHQIAAAASSNNNNNYESFWSCSRDPTSKGRNGVVTLVPPGCTLAADAAPLNDPALDAQGRCLRTDHCLVVLSTPTPAARDVGAAAAAAPQTNPSPPSSSSTSPETAVDSQLQLPPGSTSTIPFSIFNVYVPCGPPTPLKMQFLRALRRAMQKQRQQQQHIILVGDLNITAGPLDVYWNDRVVDITAILTVAHQEEEEKVNTSNPMASQWQRDVQQHWHSTIVPALATQHVVATQTTNSRTGVIYDKFRLAVTVNSCGNERRIFLGSHERTPEDCRYGYDVLEAKSYVDPETGETVVTRRANLVRVAVLSELLHKIAGIVWSDTVQREIARSAATVDDDNPARQWLNHDILQQDGMVDAFRHFYPNAQGRFTCWNQNKNRRYVNDGCRIDYTLIDASLLPYLQQGCDITAPRCPAIATTPTTMATTNSSSTSNDNVDRTTKLPVLDPLSEEAALAACTANGLFEPASFEGGGMREASRDALDTQFGPRHTGHIYTPPTFSDHIAVSVLLGSSSNSNNNNNNNDSTTRSVTLQNNLVLSQDSATRKAQPHKQQRSIASFFTAGAGTTTKPTSTSNTKRPVPGKRLQPVPPNSVLHHFAKKKMKHSG